MTTSLPVGAVERDPELAAYWSAADAQELVIATCSVCAGTWWYPRARCPYCTSDQVLWERHPGRGRIYTLTVNRRPQGPYAELDHVVIAYVELDLGLRLLTNVVGDPAELAIGIEVEAFFDLDPTGRRLLRFRPVAPDGAEGS